MPRIKRASIDVDSTHTSYLIKSALAGGIAGGVAKTAVAPLERVKILFQTHHLEYTRFTGSWRGALLALSHIMQSQGVLGLYRGHSLTLARAIPHSAIGYTVYGLVRPIFMPTKADETPARRIFTGSIAGLSVMPITYPLELVRVRMAIETKQGPNRPPSLPSAFRAIYCERAAAGHTKNTLTSVTPFSRVRRFYRGFAVSALGAVPYRGGMFLVWETLNASAQDLLSPEVRTANRHKIHLAIGAAAGTTSQIATYPLEVIRRMQQAHKSSSPCGFMGFREAVETVWRTGRWRAFYAGLGIGLVKQVPMHSISLAVWQASKKYLGV